jgi:hypothetical protein
LFRSLGYDGVAYKSAFGEDGCNVAIFNIDDFEVGWCRLVSSGRHYAQNQAATRLICANWAHNRHLSGTTNGSFQG